MPRALDSLTEAEAEADRMKRIEGWCQCSLPLAMAIDLRCDVLVDDGVCDATWTKCRIKSHIRLGG
jgi:hypothetical protein